MRKKVVALALAIVGMAMASSCSLVSGGILTGNDKAIDDTFGRIIEAIKSQDKEAIKSIFSAQTLAQYVDFEDQIDCLFEFIQGEIESWERTGGPATFGGKNSRAKNDDGSILIWKTIMATYDIKTSEQKYHVSLKEVKQHTHDSDKLGANSFCIINAADWHEKPNYWGDLGMAKEFQALGIVVDLGKDEGETQEEQPM